MDPPSRIEKLNMVPLHKEREDGPEQRASGNSGLSEM